MVMTRDLVLNQERAERNSFGDALKVRPLGHPRRLWGEITKGINLELRDKSLLEVEMIKSWSRS